MFEAHSHCVAAWVIKMWIFWKGERDCLILADLGHHLLKLPCAGILFALICCSNGRNLLYKR